MKIFKAICLLVMVCSLEAKVTLIEKENLTNPLPVMVVADNQFTNLLAYPHLIRTKLIDKVISVSIRPPQLDLFSKDMFEYSIKNHAQGKYLIHLGDALNLGCKNEWKTFTKVINSNADVHKGWVMAPGNHDFFFYGNGGGSRAFKKTGLKNLWEKVCQTDYPVKKPQKYKTHLLSKDVFVEYYLEELEKQNLGFSRNKMKCYIRMAKKDRHEPKTELRVCLYESEDENAFVQKVYSVLPLSNDLRVSYKALLIQELNLAHNKKGHAPIKAILMDSTDYPESPLLPAFRLSSGRSFVTASQNAGQVGSFRETQLSVVKNWIEQDSNSTFLLMAHHPVDTFNKQSKEGLDKITNQFPNTVYVSAHTHGGHTKEYDHFNELNLGSMTDFKPQYINLEHTQKGSLSFKRKTITIEDIKDPELCSDTYNMTDKEFGYTAYKKARNGARKMYDFTLSTIERSLIQVFEAILPGHLDPPAMSLAPTYCRNKKCRINKLNKVKSLMKEDDHVLRHQDYLSQRLRYGSCQVIWAGAAENALSSKK